MTVLKGSGVFGGIAFGKVHFYKRDNNNVKRYIVNDVFAETKRTITRLEGILMLMAFIVYYFLVFIV